MTFEEWWAKEFPNVNIHYYENSSDALTKEWFNIVKQAFEDGKSTTLSAKDARIALCKALAATHSEDGREVPETFQREDRYIVVKRSDLDKIPNRGVVHTFLAAVAEVAAHSCRIPQRKFVVIESDWPEYETVWRMIEARIAGAQPARQVGGDGRESKLMEVAFVLQDLRRFLDNTQQKRKPARDHDLNGDYVAANITSVAKTSEWLLPQVDKARLAIDDLIELDRAALAPAAVVMPTHKPTESGFDGQRTFSLGYNSALDEVARLNRRAIPEALLGRIASLLDLRAEFDPTYRPETHPVNDDAKLLIELRALLGKEEE